LKRATSDQLEEEVSQIEQVLQAALVVMTSKSKYAFLLMSKDWIKHFDR